MYLYLDRLKYGTGIAVTRRVPLFRDEGLLQRSFSFVNFSLCVVLQNEREILMVLYMTSYDVAVIQWITSFHKKCYDHTCNNTFGRNK